MRLTSPRLRRLDNALAWLPDDSEAMVISELDGFVAGIIVCPESIPSEEWLPAVWGDDALFADAREAAWHDALVLEHQAATLRTLAKGPGRYLPFLETDAATREVMWEIWIDGFEQAIALRHASIAHILDSGEEEAVSAISGLLTLVEIARDESDLERADIDARTLEAPMRIAMWIDALYHRRMRQEGVPAPLLVPEAPAPARIGRNDPCPCGSGRKSKKCCGMG